MLEYIAIVFVTAGLLMVGWSVRGEVERQKKEMRWKEAKKMFDTFDHEK